MCVTFCCSHFESKHEATSLLFFSVLSQETALEGHLLHFSSVRTTQYSLVLPFSCPHSGWLPPLLMERGWRLSAKTVLVTS